MAYRSHVDDTIPAATAILTLRVHAGIALRIVPRVTSVGREIFFSGVLHGTPIPEGGKQLVLEEETLRMKLFPGIAFRGAKGKRRACLAGTDFDVWQIVVADRAFDLAQSMGSRDGVAGARQVRLALDYYERYPEEIEAAIAEDARKLVQSCGEFPFIVVSAAA